MRTLFEILKETIALIILLGILDIAFKLFFKKTFVGKMVYFLIKNIIAASRIFLKVTKHSGKYSYKFSKMTYKLFKVQKNKYMENKQIKQVVNGNTNVVDLKKFIANKKKSS